jgi:hypothetical protein
MGERQSRPLRLGFDRRVKLEFHGARVTSDAGLLLYRELDETLGLMQVAEGKLVDPRRGRNTQHEMSGLLRQAVYGKLAGYEDTNDAERLRLDPVMRQLVGIAGTQWLGASTSEMSRFETELLTGEENVRGLRDTLGSWIDRVHRRTGLKELIPDMDSSESPTYGEQEGSAYNGYFGCTCYHPLFCFNQFGDLEGAMLREGNVASADRWDELLKPILSRYRDEQVPVYFRGDAAFARPDIYRELEAEGFFYAIRLPANAVLQDEIQHLLKRPVGHPSKKPKVLYHSFQYQAATWERARRVVAKVEWHWDEMLPRVGFVVTNLNWWSESVVRFYNRRGTAEQWIKEGKYAIKWTRLSCRDFRDNEVRLLLFGLSYNLGNFLRRLALPRSVKHWSLTTLLVKLIKIGAKVVKHARYITFQLAEVAVPRTLFEAILRKIHRLRPVPG